MTNSANPVPQHLTQNGGLKKMLPYPNIDPVAISIGPLKVHWYGLMYVIGIGATWWLARKKTERPGFPWTAAQVEDLIFYCALGLILGGRLGYVFFYNLTAFLADPMLIFRVWEGGMAFHGGMLGVLAGMWLFGRQQKIAFFSLADFIAPYVPIGLLAGRIGNFINGELWGRPTDLPWAMVFPGAGPEPRHPSQLYEAFLEGLVLLVALRWFSRRSPPRMAVSGLFLLLYGIFRFAVEFVRLPDAHIGYLAFGWLTMGQALSLPMIVFGLLLLPLAYRRHPSAVAESSAR
jgi:phosphatidylglycerol:prolipoprotein diacylglycerol transferase